MTNNKIKNLYVSPECEYLKFAKEDVLSSSWISDEGFEDGGDYQLPTFGF